MAALCAGPGARTSRGLVMAHVDEPRDGGAPMPRGTAGPALASADDRPDPAMTACIPPVTAWMRR